jgi:hypothetical protein
MVHLFSPETQNFPVGGGPDMIVGQQKDLRWPTTKRDELCISRVIAAGELRGGVRVDSRVAV